MRLRFVGAALLILTCCDSSDERSGTGRTEPLAPRTCEEACANVQACLPEEFACVQWCQVGYRLPCIECLATSPCAEAFPEDGSSGACDGVCARRSPAGCEDDPCLCDPVDCCLCPLPDCACAPPDCALDDRLGCGSASDCRLPFGFACVGGCCVEPCSSAADCAAGPECAASSLGCFCDRGLCKLTPCSADVECDGAGQLCDGGLCVAAPTAEEVASCRVEPSLGVLQEGRTVQLRVKAYRGTRPLVMPASLFTFSVTGPATVSATGLVTAGGTEGTAEVEATIGRGSCVATLTILAAPAAGTRRVVVIDELSGLPIDGATVQIEGTPALTGPTNWRGVAEFTGLGAGRIIVSAFHEEYSYVTVVGVGGSDLSIPLRRTQELAGGFKGTVGPESFFDDNSFHLALAGASLPGSFADLSFERLFGPQEPYTINFGGERENLLAAGSALGLGSQWFKQEVQGLGLPGICGDPRATAAGTCGTRAAWSLAGGAPLAGVPIDLLMEGDLELGRLLPAVLPHFQNPHSAVALDVEFQLHPEVVGAAGLPIPDFTGFTRRDLDGTHGLDLAGDVAVPTLPGLGGSPVDGAIVLGGALAPGRGLVLLGITAGFDVRDDLRVLADGKLDDIDGDSTGLVTLRMAPGHGGLEGSRYAVIAIALNLHGAGRNGICSTSRRSGCNSYSGLVQLLDARPAGTALSFPGGFLPFAEDARFDPATRRHDLGTAVAGATLHRMILTDDEGREWSVFTERGSFTLPLPPAGMQDRATRSDGSRSSLSVQALALSVGLDVLVGPGPGLAELAGVTTAFSTTEVP